MLQRALIAGLFSGFCLLAPRLVQAGECAFDTDCPGVQVCLDQVCADPSEPLPMCDSDPDCEVGSCVDGACKREGVHCAAEDGSECQFYASSFECLCADGTGFGGAGGSPDDEPPKVPDPAELYGQCLEGLASCEEFGGDGDGDGDGDDDGDIPDGPPEDDDEGGNGGSEEDGGEQGGEADQELGDDVVEGRGCRMTETGAGGLAALALLGLRRRRQNPMS